MQQLLPEVVSVFEKLRGEKRDEPVNKEWRDFVSLVNKVDELVEQEKQKILEKIPQYMREPVKDAFYIKKNNDRAVATYIATLCAGAIPENFISILVAMDIHDFSVTLIDDIMDNQEKRNNGIAHHVKWGINLSLSVGMFLKSLSSQIVIDANLNEAKKLRVLREIEDLHTKVYKGEFLDVQFESMEIDKISTEDYLHMINLTTGSQFCGFLRIGGILGDATISQLQLLGKIGEKLGILGQIRDDLVDYLADEKEIGKTSLLDFKTGKRRLPLLLAWKYATPEEKKRIKELQRKKEYTSKEYMEIINIVMKPEVVREIKDLMRQIKQEGLGLIDKAEFTSEGKRLLRTYFSYGMGEI